MAPSQTAPRHWDGNQMWVGQDASVTEVGGSSRSSVVIDTESKICMTEKNSESSMTAYKKRKTQTGNNVCATPRSVT